MSNLAHGELVASPAFRLLVACADWPRSDARNAAIREAAAVPGAMGPVTSGPSLMDLVDRHRMAPIALDGLTCAGVDLPDRLLERAQQDKMQALAIAREGRKLIELLASHGIEAIMLKGPVLSQYLYGDPGMRQSIDLDLMVDWENFAAARKLLGEQDFALVGTEPPWGERRMDLWRLGGKDVTLIRHGRGLRVELHHRLKTPEALLPGFTIARATNAVSLAGTQFRTFTRKDLFVYLAVHEATTLWHRLKWLADLRALLVGCSVAEIEQMVDHARKYRVERCAALALLLCHRFWQQELPAGVLRMREEDPRLAQLETGSLQVLADPDDRMRNFGQTRVTTTTFHLRNDWDYRRSLLGSILFEPDIVASFRLPRALSFLYIPLRLVVWFRRRQKQG
ncbi:nucleotidyltransferase family protein [Alteraurantiacibacter aestuarii]|uniref:nucleotidyltransferase domain-containing protein n=1 Tax=Alteraurantiacibacter aestuarii TaxID=650004 RepID=UPI0031D2BBA2